MAGEKQNGAWSVVVDKDLRPAYYDQFQCLAEGCRLSCCVGWHITFDKKDYLSLKQQNGSPELTEHLDRTMRRLRNNTYNIREMYAEFKMSDGRCPLLRDDGLCMLQAEKGHKALPEVCRVFPRTGHNMVSGYAERSLSPACEAVLELLWELPEGVGFVSDPLPRDKWRKVTALGDAALLRYFADIRELCIDFLQDRRFPLPRRILMMGMALRELVEGERDVPRWLARLRTMADELASAPFPAEREPEKIQAMCLMNALQVFNTLGTNNPHLKGIKEEILRYCGPSLVDGSQGDLLMKPYYTARERFEENFGDRAYFFENLMVSLLFLMGLPNPTSTETLWKGYVNFCNLYALYRFAAVMSCREGAAGDKAELIRMMVYASRALIHNSPRRNLLRDELFQNDSATLAHTAVLLSG